LAWALPSMTHAALAAVLFTVWCGTEGMTFESPMHAGPLLILLLLGPLVLWKRSRFLLVVLIPAFVLSLLFAAVATAAHADERIGFAMLLNLGALLVAAGLLTQRTRRFPEFAPIFSFFGWGLYLVLLYILTFPGTIHETLYCRPEHWSTYIAYWLVPLVVCLATWAMVAHQAIVTRRGLGTMAIPLESFLVPLSVVLSLYAMFASQADRELRWEAAGPFNLVFLALAVSLMARGCRRALLWPTVTGSLLLVVLVLSRYADLFASLFVRGLIFILIGALIFAEGVFYARARRHPKEEVQP